MTSSGTARRGKKCSIVVLFSGRGSNLQALLEAAKSPACPYQVVCAISNNPQAPGLAIASSFAVPTKVIDHRKFSRRQDFDDALGDAVASWHPDGIHPDGIVLAGFMRILGTPFVRRFTGKILNIHPALLPRHRGLHTHRRVLDAGDKEHGATVHFVIPELDAGPPIAQTVLRIRPGESEEELAARTLKREHVLLPTVVCWYAEDRIVFKADRAYLNDELLPLSGIRVRLPETHEAQNHAPTEPIPDFYQFNEDAPPYQALDLVLEQLMALTTPSVRSKLLSAAEPQLRLLDKQLAEVEYEEKRLVLLRDLATQQGKAQDKAQDRHEDKLRRLQKEMDERNAFVADSSRADPEASLRQLKRSAKKHGLARFVEFILHERILELRVNEQARVQDAALNGCYVLKYDIPAEQMSSPNVHDRRPLEEGA